ncbi:MAG: PBSX family phage terminase large subunit [Acidaminococcus fermentans]|nr:PBSX family phage terminase large subunit [Acidaminococcus fermentans]MDY2852832.1 PBSX family phage terminase large subunit [Acidaminococcus fermentans]
MSDTARVSLSSLLAPSFYGLHRAVKHHDYTHYWLKGGRGSTKSSFISVEIILQMMQHPNVNGVAFRKVGNTARNSIYEQLLWAIQQLGVAAYWKKTFSPLELTYLPTGQKILFRGLDEENKGKSIKCSNGYFGIVWFEELAEFNGLSEIDTTLRSLLRGGPEYWVFYSYNPPKSRDSWVNQDALVDTPDRIVHTSSYLDVPREWLGEQFFLEAEKLKLKNETLYRHVYLGEVTGTGGAVFDNVEALPMTTEQIGQFDHRYFGLDFGFAVDPLAFVAMHYDAKHEDLYIWGEVYEQKLTNPQAARKISQVILPGELVRCDSAEPKSIKELKGLGLNAIGAMKGPDSVDYGIKWLQSRAHIFIDKNRCPNTYKEFVCYEYEQNRQGQYISAYPDKDNHAIDAVRYGCSGVMPVRTTIRSARFDY